MFVEKALVLVASALASNETINVVDGMRRGAGGGDKIRLTLVQRSPSRIYGGYSRGATTFSRACHCRSSTYDPPPKSGEQTKAQTDERPHGKYTGGIPGITKIVATHERYANDVGQFLS